MLLLVHGNRVSSVPDVAPGGSVQAAWPPPLGGATEERLPDWVGASDLEWGARVGRFLLAGVENRRGLLAKIEPAWPVTRVAPETGRTRTLTVLRATVEEGTRAWR